MVEFSHIRVVLVGAVFATFLPYSFGKCSLRDPNVNKCLTKSVIAKWPKLVQGDKRKHILILDPLNVPFLQFPVHENLVGNVTEAFIYGLQDMKINDIDVNLEEKTLDAKFLIPRLTLYGNYDVNGKILGKFPLIGQGTVNFTLYDVDSHLHMDYNLIKYKQKQYIAVYNNSMKYNTTKMYFNLTNLFGGDEMMGYLTNSILNDNWEAVNREIGSTVGAVFGETFTEVSKRFFKNNSIEDIFAP